MKTINQKREALQKLKDKISKAKVSLFTTFARSGEPGLSVSQIRELRNKLREVDAEYLVEKKTLLSKSLRYQKKDIDVDAFEGSVGTVFGFGDQIAPMKQVFMFAKANPALRYLAGLMDDKILTAEDITTLAKLPSRDILLSQLVGMLSHPMRSFASVIDQIAKKRTV